jgi:hypothetical protein
VTDEEAVVAEFGDVAAEYNVDSITISAVTGDGVRRLLGRLFELVADDGERT